jgi:hypothetical protein
MKYYNLNKYVSKHILFMYLIFLFTGILFFWKFSYIIKAEPDIVVFTDTIPFYIDSSKTHKNVFRSYCH